MYYYKLVSHIYQKWHFSGMLEGQSFFWGKRSSFCFVVHLSVQNIRNGIYTFHCSKFTQPFRNWWRRRALPCCLNVIRHKDTGLSAAFFPFRFNFECPAIPSYLMGIYHWSSDKTKMNGQTRIQPRIVPQTGAARHLINKVAPLRVATAFYAGWLQTEKSDEQCCPLYQNADWLFSCRPANL